MKSLLTKIFVVLIATLLLFTSFPTNTVSADEVEDEVVTESYENEQDVVQKDEKDVVLVDEQPAESIEDSDSQDSLIGLGEKDDLFVSTVTVTQINPELEDSDSLDLIPSEELDILTDQINSDGDSTVYTTTDAAVEFIVGQIESHTESFGFKYYYTTGINDDFQASLNQISDEIRDRVPFLLNDYISHNTNKSLGCKYSASGSYIGSNTYGWHLTSACTISFRTTKEQELELNQLSTALLNQLNLYNSNDYQKVKGVYDWVTSNISYDHDALLPSHDPNDETPWTAWKAIKEKKAVCQGYSLLMYKLLNALGIEVYYAYGDADNGEGSPEGHAWNVVNLYGNYYLLDSTWDASYKKVYNSYKYFLKGTNSVFYTDHFPDDDYRNNRYVVSTTDYDPSYVPPAPVAVSGVTLTPSTKSLYVDETLQLTATVLPADAANKKVTYISSDPTVASVDSFGLVTAKKAGSTVITVTTEDGSHTAQSTITVEQEEVFIPVTRITASQTYYEIDLSDTNRYKIDVTVEPEDATIKDLIYSSSDESVATVDENGYITVHGIGTTKVSILPVSNGYSDVQASKINVNIKVTSDHYTVNLHFMDGKVVVDGQEYNEYTFYVDKNSYTYNRNYQAIPNDANKGFVGWYLDEELTEKFDGSYIDNNNEQCIREQYIRSDIDLYAKYDEMVTLTLDFNGGYY